MSTDNSAVKTYYSPWMPAEGNCAVCCCEVVATNLMQGFAITVQTKNSDQILVPTGKSVMVSFVRSIVLLEPLRGVAASLSDWLTN